MNVIYKDGFYWRIVDGNYFLASSEEVDHAIANAVNHDDWDTYNALTCPCGLSWERCNPSICNKETLVLHDPD